MPKRSDEPRWPFQGWVEVLDADGAVLGRVKASLVKSQGDDGVLPSWQGRVVVGRPAWLGSLEGLVDWRALVDSQVPVTLRFDDGRLGQCLAIYTGQDAPDIVQVHGGPPAPFDNRRNPPSERF